MIDEVNIVSRNFGISAKEFDSFLQKHNDKDAEELKSVISALEAKKKSITAEINLLGALLVSKIAEFEIGERVLVTENGKQNTFEITRRSPGFSLCNVRYWGRVVKKDGNLGKQDRDMSYYRIEKIKV